MYYSFNKGPQGHVDSVSVQDLTSNYKHMQSTGYPVILDPEMLADTLGVKVRTLFWVGNPYCQRGSSGKDGSISRKPMYTVKKLPKGRDKKTGEQKFRTIQAPCRQLKYVQKRIQTEILDKVELPEFITGFRKNSSILDTADVHTGKSIVVSVDLKNYFNSITQKHLVEVFTQMFRYPKKVAKLLSEICTYKFFVPQGAPSSPALANIVGLYFFDNEVKAITDKYGFTMTRYADDITMSTDKDYPKELKTLENGAVIAVSEIDTMLNEIQEVLSKNNFKINPVKTKVMRTGSRKWVMGTVVNGDKPTILRSKRKILKAIVHNIHCNGITAEAEKTGKSELQFIQWVRGSIAYFQQIDPERGSSLKIKFDDALAIHGFTDTIAEIPVKL